MQTTQLIEFGSRILQNNGIATHRIDSEIILAHVLNQPRERILIEEKFVHEKIKNDCSEFTSHLIDEDIPNNVKRKCFYIDPTHDIYKLLDSDEVKTKLGFHGYELSVDVPVEYRVYGMGGHMNWHSDTQLYVPEQYELIYTIDNTSDMTFKWKQHKN